MAGSVTPYPTNAGRRWEVRYRRPDGGTTRKRGFLRKADAEQHLAAVTISKVTGDYVDPARGRATVASRADDWLRKKAGLKPSYANTLESAWRVHVEPKWGHRTLTSIESAEIEAWIQDMREGTAPTVRRGKEAKRTYKLGASVILRNLGVLAGILDDAVRDRRLTTNPARGLENLPRKSPDQNRRYLTDAEIARFVEHIDNYTHAVLILLLAYTGLRWGEATGLRVKDINPLRKRIHVRQNAVDVHGTIHLGTPKTWELRTVPLFGFLAEPIAALCDGKAPDALVFQNDAGSYVLRPKGDQIGTSWFRAAQKKAGLERFRIHDLRHTAASLAISSGANVKVVQKMLGHKSAAMTLDTYSDLFDSDLDDIAERMSKRGGDTAGPALKSVSKLRPRLPKAA